MHKNSRFSTIYRLLEMSYGKGQKPLVLSHNPEVAGSSPAAATKTKDICFQQMSFVLGSAAQRAAPPCGISMLGVGRAAPAQFPAAGREFTRHSARGPEGPLGGSLATVLSIPNIDFDRPFQTMRIRTTSSRRVMCSDLSFQ